MGGGGSPNIKNKKKERFEQEIEIQSGVSRVQSKSDDVQKHKEKEKI